MNTLAFGLGSFSGMDMILILAVGLLIFGKRLPEVGKSLGKGIVEFKKGLKGIEDDVENGSNRPSPPRRDSLEDRENQYRQPLSDGQDRRVSRQDKVDETQPPPNAHPHAEH